MMKLLKRTMFVFCISCLFCVAAFSYKANDSVMVEWKGGWYPAKILKVENNKYLIHYDDHASSWDEWVTENRIKSKPARDFDDGESVMVKWKGTWYPAKVLKFNNNKYLIHYDGYESSWDEWVGTNRMKKK